jgi:hypothetical protein
LTTVILTFYFLGSKMLVWLAVEHGLGDLVRCKHKRTTKVSIMRLIQRSCTTLRADSSDAAARAVTNVIMTTVPPQILECAQKMRETKRKS